MGRKRIKQHFGKNKEFFLPDYQGVMECLEGESLMFYGWEEYKSKKYRLFQGIGIVYRVAHGLNCDYVYINFGITPDHPRKCIVVIDNHSRRQILTLKRGQPCQVYGVAMFYKNKKKTKEGNEYDKLEISYYAKGIQGWYVPTMIDIKKTPRNEDISELLNFEEEREKEQSNEFVDVLDLFKGE